VQVAKPVSMAAFELFNAKQFAFANIDLNKISKAGGKWLSKANWR